jgi:hypothetical protein
MMERFGGASIWMQQTPAKVVFCLYKNGCRRFLPTGEQDKTCIFREDIALNKNIATSSDTSQNGTRSS